MGGSARPWLFSVLRFGVLPLLLHRIQTDTSTLYSKQSTSDYNWEELSLSGIVGKRTGSNNSFHI